MDNVPEAAMGVGVPAGSGALGLSLRIAAALVLRIAIMVFSYRQMIEACTEVGGASMGARKNLGTAPSPVAALVTPRWPAAQPAEHQPEPGPAGRTL